MEEQFRLLLIRFLNNECSQVEEQQVHQLLERPEMMALLHQLMEERDSMAEKESRLSDDIPAARAQNWQRRIHDRISASGYPEQQPSGKVRFMGRPLWLRYAAVFVGFLFLAGVSWQFVKTTVHRPELAQEESIQPGGNKALLTLADGSVISLSDAQNGTIAAQNGVRIEKDADGDVRYTADGKPAVTTLAMNTLATPNGGQYRITLPDGSVAMLNAASSLSYPVHFNGKERRVKMTGEVYFEIAKATDSEKKRIPFFVETDRQEIQVLGTHFNVNAYTDEKTVRTTLVEGSVKVTAHNGQSALLKPGQQALLAGDLKVGEADIQQELGWKDGDFIFLAERLEDVLRQVARWYDVEVECPQRLANVRFTGMVSRSQPLSMIEEMIETTKNLKVTIKERRFIVTD